jgi:hypothetical protein
MIAIAEANYQSGYRIKLKFNTGEEGVVDLSDLIERYDVAAPLKICANFNNFTLMNGRHLPGHADLMSLLKRSMNEPQRTECLGVKHKIKRT